ncbi:nucleotide exchange factor GrpE [Nocardia yamanashiensis]|uniref:nucleotide exchange factor GrpE n=1 Tax=Nocardia yamanashiensis TaxID=209247 RepID=UPI000A0654EB|nr:nucleotide exchange factor GrpE [Nocardia yamanashiensis]
MTEPAAATGNFDCTDDPGGDGGSPPGPALPAPATDPATDRITERIDDLARVIARQAATIERLADDAKARDRRERAGADVPLVVELFALFDDARTLAATAGSDTERAAFETFANRLERLLTGRGGQTVEPKPGAPFDALTMEAADVLPTGESDLDRTVHSVVQPGLTVAGRSVRPAKVVVHRHRPVPKSDE